METNTILIHTNFSCVVARVTKTTTTQATSTKGMFLKLSLKNTLRYLYILTSISAASDCLCFDCNRKHV